MKTARKLAMALCAVVTMAGLQSCEKNKEPVGLAGADVKKMTDKMAPDLLQIKEITQNPNKIVIVLKPITNKTMNPTQSMGSLGLRLRQLLNTYARDRVAFVEEMATVQRFQAEEVGTTDPFEQASRTGVNPNGALVPEFALHGTVEEMRNGNESYFFCSFQLTRIAGVNTREIIWEGKYEMTTGKN